MSPEIKINELRKKYVARNTIVNKMVARELKTKGKK